MSRHPDFKTLEASRPAFAAPKEQPFTYTQTPKPSWVPGTGATSEEWKKHKSVVIDPHAEDRVPVDNYKLLISGIVPRPIGFLSTISKAGVRNLAPMSYFQTVNHDPPIFTVGVSGGTGIKDSAANLLETGECTLNIISDWFVEAANYCSIDAPGAVSEWDLSGLTPVESELVGPPRVAESAFSIEAKLIHHHQWHSHANPEKKTGTLMILEGLRFIVREDALNEQKNMIDINVLRPISRMGGISYATVTEGFEIPRPSWVREKLVGVPKEVAEKAEKAEAGEVKN